MNQRTKVLILSIVLIIIGTVLGIFSYLQINKNLIFSLVASFIAVFSIVLGMNLLVIKVVMKK